MKNSICRVVVIILVLSLLIISYSNLVSSSSNPSTKSKNVVRIGVDDTIPPYSYLENKKPVGFNIDLLKAMEKYTNFSFEFVPGTWHHVITWLRSGKVDAVMAMVPTAQRNKTFLFTHVYQHLYFNFFQRASMPSITSISDIANHTMAVVKGDITESFAKEWMNRTHKNLYLVEVSSAEEALKLLNSNSVDLFLYEIHTCSYYISSLNLKNVELTNVEAFSMPIAIAVKKSKPWLVKELNFAIEKVKASGEYTQIYNTWFNPENKNELPWYFYVSAIILAVSTVTAGYVGVKYVRNERRIKEQNRRIKNLRNLSHTLMENMPIGLLYIKDGKCLYANKEALKILGYSIGELNKFKFFRYLENGEEIKIKTKQGRFKWLLTKSISYGDGRIISIIDITEKKLLEIKEKERFEFLNDMLDALRNPVQNLLFSVENIEEKEMQDIIKKEVEKISNILRKEPE